jgi:hypothetical protein
LVFPSLWARWITAAVKILVVMQDVECGAFKAWKDAQDCPAIFRVFLHQSIVVFIEARRFSKNCIWNSNLADTDQGLRDEHAAALSSAQLMVDKNRRRALPGLRKVFVADTAFFRGPRAGSLVRARPRHR